MANLLSDADISAVTTVMQNHFETFAQEFTVFKLPIKIFSFSPDNVLPGYRDESIESSFTYTSISGTYSGIFGENIDNISNPLQKNLNSINMRLPTFPAFIKVKEDARAFIINGKNEKVIVDYRTFNFTQEEAVQNYMGLKFYYFGLERTK